MKTLYTLLVTLVAAGSALSQQNIVYNTSSPLKKDFSDGRNFPFCGQQGSRSQFIVPQSVLTVAPAVPVVIKDIFLQTHLVDVNHVNEDIEIRMGITKVAYGSLDKTWDNNMPLSAATVVYRGPLNYNLRMNTWKPIGLPASYTFLPMAADENLCIDVIIHKSSNTPYGALGGCGSAYVHGEALVFSDPLKQHQINYECQYTTSNSVIAQSQSNGVPSLGFLLGSGNFVVSGLGGVTSPPLKRVEISADTYPQPGKPMKIMLSGAPNRASIIAFGFQFDPFDMAAIGAPRSTIWFTPLIQVGLVSNPLGETELPFVIPATGATSGTLYAQWYQIDPGAYANKLGLTTSNCGTLILGN